MGCVGSLQEIQPYDSALPKARDGRPIMWGKSVPTNLEWPDIAGMVSTTRARGYDVIAVVPVRGWYPMTRSQVMRGRVASIEEAESNIRRAVEYTAIELRAAGVEWVTVVYEELLTRPADAPHWLAERLGLLPYKASCALDIIRDENAKHWCER